MLKATVTRSPPTHTHTHKHTHTHTHTQNTTHTEHYCFLKLSHEGRAASCFQVQEWELKSKRERERVTRRGLIKRVLFILNHRGSTGKRLSFSLFFSVFLSSSFLVSLLFSIRSFHLCFLIILMISRVNLYRLLAKGNAHFRNHPLTVEEW